MNSIMLIIFRFIQIESTCCSGGNKQPKPIKEKKPKKQKPKKADKDAKDKSADEKASGTAATAESAKPESGKSSAKDKEKSGKPSPYQVFIPRNLHIAAIWNFF